MSVFISIGSNRTKKVLGAILLDLPDDDLDFKTYELTKEQTKIETMDVGRFYTRAEMDKMEYQRA